MGGERFSYRGHANGALRIFWEGRCVLELGDERGKALAAALEAAGAEEEPYLLRRATGDFKRGNERRSRRRRPS